MVRGPKKKFRHDKKQNTLKRKILLGISLLLIFAGGYLLYLTLAPTKVISPLTPSAIDLNTEDDDEDMRNRIQIEKINLEVPFFEGDASTLEKGSWWRFPERGNPEKGGNFILSAHRFYLGLTPQGTRERSPFYNLEKLEVGNQIRVFYEKEWYDYIVTDKYEVKPNAVEIEWPTEEHRLTLYTCTLGGSADGRVVIEAKPL
jgi:sortase A